MASPHETIVKTLTEARQQELLESGLSRINHHLNDGKDLAILSSNTDENKDIHRDQKAMIRHIRGMGYGPIVSRGRTKEWGSESSVIVPGMTLGHLKQVGEKFKQKAVLHYKGSTKTASNHYLSTSDKPGTSEELGAAHFNKPNDHGITVLKGAGYQAKDERNPTRHFTFSKENVNKDTDVILESLMRPPRPYCPDWTYYRLEE